MEISEGNTTEGTIREIRIDGAMAIIRIQFGDNIVESFMPGDMAEEIGLKVGDNVTAMIESTPVSIKR